MLLRICLVVPLDMLEIVEVVHHQAMRLTQSPLRRVGGEVEPLAAALGGGNVEARKYALVALAKIGPPAKAALPAIEKAAKDSDADVQKLAAEALKRIGSP